jgi:protein-S-isoprenylcysteine O-methyltransferase Ste14
LGKDWYGSLEASELPRPGREVIPHNGHEVQERLARLFAGGEGFVRVIYWVDVASFLVFGAFVMTRGGWNARFLLGMGLALAGFTLWMVARFQLGESLSARAQAKALVITGLYSRFRHPIYLFGGLAFVGLLVAWGSVWGFLYLLSLPIQIWRIRKEEAVMDNRFGEAYRRYKASTWF